MENLRENRPTADILMTSMRAMGYSFESAISDIVDNSVSASARNIWLRFPVDPSDCYIAICDDGYGMNKEEHDQEGRLISLEFEDYYVITCYTPNSQNELKRLDYRQVWEDDFLEYLLSLDKPIILCGDLNVAHQEIDLKNPKANRKNAGFSDEERAKMTQLLSHGFIDTYRYLYPDVEGVYSWWSYRFKAREKNAGWRIDYFIVSDCLKGKIQEATIETTIMGSDHCPVTLTIDL